MSDIPATGRQLLTEVTSEGKLKLTIAQAPVQAPDGSKVLVRVEASPINPSDLGLLLGMADVETARQTDSGGNPSVEADIPANILPHLKARWDHAMLSLIHI